MGLKICIGVIGGSEASTELLEMARQTGRLIAGNGAVLVCGGLGGIMEAASKGARENGGEVIGILPSADKSSANPYVTIAIATGMGMTRNSLVVLASDALIAFPGSYGTLSEISLALTAGKTVVYLPGVWDLKKAGEIDIAKFKEAYNPAQAVGLALASIIG